MSGRWEPCTKLLQIQGRGSVRCWKPSAVGATTGLCTEHEREREAEEESRALTHAIQVIRQAVVDLHQQILPTLRFGAEEGQSEDCRAA